MNSTPYAALDAPIEDPRGVLMALTVVKGTFRFDGTPADHRMPVRWADVFWEPDAPQGSSIRWPSDLALAKHGSDVVVVGEARSPRPTKRVDVVVRAGQRRVHLRVHGERMYYRGAGGRVVVGEGAAFVQKPIVYERAYGGISADALLSEPRNPIGRGMAATEDELVDTPAPQVELADEPITSAGDRPAPVGLGAIAANWQPRAGFGGTFDERWQKERMPLMPEDFDPRFNNAAHPLLQLAEPLAPGLSFGVDGMSLDGPIAAQVPDLGVTVTGLFDDGSVRPEPLVLDTLVIDTEGARFAVSGRVAFPVGRGPGRLRAIRVEHG
ncbi:MAG: DUF2169 domain-containing protein [Polyangiaceae bacterium]